MIIRVQIPSLSNKGVEKDIIDDVIQNKFHKTKRRKHLTRHDIIDPDRKP